MDEKILTHIVVNNEEYKIGGGSDVDLSNYYTKDEEAFIKTESNGAKMSGCTASGQCSVAEGSSTIASSTCSHAEGSGTQASGSCSHAEGAGTKAYGAQSHAEGGGTTASGSNSHAEGSGTQASSNGSHAEGGGTTASGQFSHAEGSSTIASGNTSHAEGGGTRAYGDYSHAEGYNTSATTQSEHASGQHNISLSGSSTFGDSGNTLFTVGNGSGSSMTHNAFEIRQNGDIYISDTSGEGEYYEKPMIKLQELINRISELETKVATLITKAEVEKGFNNVITVENGTNLKIRNNALEDESAE